MIETLPLAKIYERVGDELGKTDWMEIDQQRINTFADCTNDQQWIHVDEKAAASGPFGKTIAHGFLTVSLLSYFGAEIGVIPEGTAMAINYGMNKVRLLNPVPVDSKIRDTIVLTDITEKPGDRVLMTTTHTVEIEGQEKPACVAEVLSMFFIQK